MSRRWVVVVLMVLVGCGGESSSPPDFPKGHINPAGNFYVPVKDGDEAERLCNAAQDGGWPESYPDQVTFDLPNTGSDYTCVR